MHLRRGRSLALFFTCVALTRFALAETADIRWGGGTGPNMVSEAKGLPDDPGNTAPLWEIKVGTHQYSIPTIDRGRIYIAATDTAVERAGYKPTSGGLVMCVDQGTGKLIWQLPIPRYFDGVKPPYHFDQWKCGVCSGPVVDGDCVYVVGSRGEILCLERHGQTNGNQGPVTNELSYLELNGPDVKLEPTDGDIIWRYQLIPELDVVLHDVCGSTLLLVGDYLYACTGNGIDDRHDKVPRLQAPTLIVLDKKTGRLIAKDGENIGTGLLHCNWSSPVFGQAGGKSLIFFGAGDGFLYAFEPPLAAADGQVQTLKKVWAYDCNPPGYRMRDGQPVRYSTHSKNSLEGPSEVISTPVFHHGRVYVAIGQSPVHGTGQGCLSCVDAATGSKVWTSTLVERTLATVAIADGLLYTNGFLTTLVAFNYTNGIFPSGALIQGGNGDFYGATERGGSNGYGTIFRMSQDGVLTTLVSFNGTNGAWPEAGLVQATDGEFYGTTSAGGTGENGTIFKISPSGVLTTLVSFDGINGASPQAALVQDCEGNFYGTTLWGGRYGRGTVYKMTPSGVLTTLFSFNEEASDAVGLLDEKFSSFVRHLGKNTKIHSPGRRFKYGRFESAGPSAGLL